MLLNAWTGKVSTPTFDVKGVRYAFESVLYCAEMYGVPGKLPARPVISEPTLMIGAPVVVGEVIWNPRLVRNCV